MAFRAVDVHRTDFNPRSPRGERQSRKRTISKCSTFQSTLPAWGATRTGCLPRTCRGNFNPRSPRGERRKRTSSPSWHGISIHAPRVGSDDDSLCHWRLSSISIHAPRVGSDGIHLQDLRDQLISIHAPRVGSDSTWPSILTAESNFNPRSPRGERLLLSARVSLLYDFNPRSPRGERPRVHPRERADAHFNPRSPRGERRSCCACCLGCCAFQSPLPAWGATRVQG